MQPLSTLATTMGERATRGREALVGSLFSAPCKTQEALRREILHQSTGQAPTEALPPEVASWTDIVAHRPTESTDADISRLREADWSEDAIFEMTIGAAVGTGLRRLDRVTALLAEGA